MGAGFYLEPSHPAYVRDDVCRGGRRGHRPRLRRCRPTICPIVAAGLIGEIGVSKDFTPAEEKVLRGAARASRMTGVPLTVHLPGWERLAHRVLDVVEQEGGDLRHTVLCHMNPSQQRSQLISGAWLTAAPSWNTT